MARRRPLRAAWRARIEAGVTNSAGKPQIAIDANGNALAVWNRFNGGSRNDIWANRYTAATTTWGTALLIETGNAGTAENPTIAIDANRNGVALWNHFDGARYDVMATHYVTATGTWGQAAISLAASAVSSGDMRVAIDDSGNALVVWRHEEGFTRADIWANRYTASVGWGTAALIETDNAGSAIRPQIAMDCSGNAIAVWDQFDANHRGIWANSYR